MDIGYLLAIPIQSITQYSLACPPDSIIYTLDIGLDQPATYIPSSNIQLPVCLTASYMQWILVCGLASLIHAIIQYSIACPPGSIIYAILSPNIQWSVSLTGLYMPQILVYESASLKNPRSSISWIDGLSEMSG
jgi:hypothetical protein